jgi:DNA-binding protein H-NS
MYSTVFNIGEDIMRGLKLKTMSFDDLVELRDSVLQLISDKAASTRRDLEERLAAIDGLGFSKGAKRGPKPRGSKLKGRKVAPKYRNPKNRAETWAGRGATPRWLRAMIKSGHKLEEFAIGKPGRKAKR